LIGPRIISGGILFTDGFALYGGIGKAMIFGFIAFALLVRRRKTVIVLRPWEFAQLKWIVIACIAFGLAWASINHLLAGQHDTLYLLGAHAGLLLSVIFLAIGCVGSRNTQFMWYELRYEAVVSLAIAAAFYLFLLVVYALWQPLAFVVLVGVRGMLDMSGVHSMLIQPNTLMFDKFGITVAEYCSGIESIALFTGLYVVVGLLDWERLNKKRYFIVFPFALFILSVLNIVRIYLLILAGYYINPEIAFSLFHTYAGLVFFILYSALFWMVAYGHLLKRDDTHDRQKIKTSREAHV
jgi:exosortase/archaeosortase family protein